MHQIKKSQRHVIHLTCTSKTCIFAQKLIPPQGNYKSKTQIKDETTTVGQLRMCRILPKSLQSDALEIFFGFWSCVHEIQFQCKYDK